MTDPRDNPPPLPKPKDAPMYENQPYFNEDEVRQIEAAAFERGKAATQGEIERPEAECAAAADHIVELRTKFKALEGQKPVAWMAEYIDREGEPEVYVTTHHALAVENDSEHTPKPLYLAAGAKP